MTAGDTIYNARESLRQPVELDDRQRDVVEHLGINLLDGYGIAEVYAALYGGLQHRYHRTLAQLVFLEAEVRGFNIFQLARLKEGLGITGSSDGMTLVELGQLLDAIKAVGRPRAKLGHGCACQETDGYDCWAFQNGLDADVDEDTVFSGGPCECACHGDV